MTILKAKHISKTYYDSGLTIHVLNDINLEVEEGAFITISGQSGSGKSTLLHLIGLLDKPDKGEIIIANNKVQPDSPEAPIIRNKFIGFVFQFHYLISDLNAIENVVLPLLVSSIPKGIAMKEAENILRVMGLSDRLHHYPHQLSGGEQQRVALARALINKPKIVLADEPTGNLDPLHSKEVLELMHNLNKEFKAAFILVTHDPDIALSSHRHYVLKDGVLQ